MLITDRISLTTRKITDEGFLEISAARIGRSGIQEYSPLDLGMVDRDPTEVIRIFRPPEEVFKDESMKSFANKPVTNGHPSEKVSSKNAKKVQVGFSSDKIWQDGIFLNARLTITDSDTIRDIAAGKVELSNGYSSEVIFKDGVTPEGEQFDAVQSDIMGNHIAIVERGRCGGPCRIDDKHNIEGIKMGTIVLNNVSYEITDQTKEAVNQVISDLQSANKAISEKNNLIKDLEKSSGSEKNESKLKLDTLQAKFDDLKARQPTPEMLDAIVESRLEVIKAAGTVIEDFDSKGKDCASIMKEVVLSVHPSLDITDKSSDYIQARFDSICDLQKSEDHMGLVKDLQNFSKDTSDIVDSEKARLAANKRSAEAWKNPIKSVR